MERTLLVCREGSASNIISNLVLALDAKKAGSEVEVLFTEEALVALCKGVFDWPRQLQGQALRLTLADNGLAAGLPTMGGKGEARQLDVRQLVTSAAHSGVTISASALWLKLTGLQARLPQGVTTFESGAALDLLKKNSVRSSAI